MAPYAFKKFYALQTRTPGVVDGASGLSALLSASGPKLGPHVMQYLWIAERKAVARRGRTTIHIVEMDKRG